MNFFILIFFNKLIIIINKMTDNKLIDNLDNENIPVFSVSEITTEITNLLEKKYNYIKIKGEISGETGNKYPEIYFSLKDNNNVISAIIKRNKISFLKFKLVNKLLNCFALFSSSNFEEAKYFPLSFQSQST